MQRPFHLMLMAVCGLTACSKSPEPVETPGPAAVTPAAAPAAATTAGSIPRDLSSIDLCKIILPAEVATAAGGTLATEPAWKGNSCMYVIETPEGTES